MGAATTYVQKMNANASLGPYELIKRLAIGGTAEIYLARRSGQIEGFEKYFALKAILPHKQGDEDAEKAILDEGRLHSQLRHDNIVAVHDLDRDDGRTFLVMEYVPGQDLSVVIDTLREKNGLLAHEVSAYIAREVCSGLHYVHTRRAPDDSPLELVHRDISPQNVLVGIEGDVKLIDFGVAKARSQGRLETQTGIIKGKLKYMAPEYAVGNLQDSRSDIFALGLVLFELITGRPAYDESKCTPQELVEQIKHAQIPSLSELRPDVPGELAAIVDRALRPHPDDRYQTAQEIQQDLSVYLAHTAPHFTKAHFSTYIARLFDRLGLVPELTTTVNASGIDLESVVADDVSRETTGDLELDDQSTGRLDFDAIDGESSPTLEPTDQNIDVQSVREPRAIPGPRLASVPAPSSKSSENPVVEAPRLLTPTGFNRLVRPGQDEGREARVSSVPAPLRRQALRGADPPSIDIEIEPVEPLSIDPVSIEPVETIEPLSIDPGAIEPLEPEPILTDSDPSEPVPNPLDDAATSATEPVPIPEGARLPGDVEPEMMPTEAMQRPVDARLPGSTDLGTLSATSDLEIDATMPRERPKNASLPSAPQAFRTSEHRTPAGLPTHQDNSQPVPIFTHPMTGAPVSENHIDSSGSFTMAPTAAPSGHFGAGGAPQVDSGSFQQPAFQQPEPPRQQPTYQHPVQPPMPAQPPPPQLQSRGMASSSNGMAQGFTTSAPTKPTRKGSQGRKLVTMAFLALFSLVFLVIMIWVFTAPD